MSRYQLKRKIGEGGMGVVYEAIQQPLDRIVALKLLPSSLISSAEAISRFLREIQACTKLVHPHIIKILDCGKIKGQPFFAMDYLEAKTLREILDESGPMGTLTVLEVGRQIADALAYCHRQNLIHRDVKPHNIMVDRSNHSTLMDFGLVKMLERSGITNFRTILGTVNYVSPEMLQGKEVGAGADIFALGLVLYEMLSAQRAFPGKDLREVGDRILRTEPRPIDSFREDCPPDLIRIVARCLRKRPEERYASAEDVAGDLARVESGEKLVQSARGGPLPPPALPTMRIPTTNPLPAAAAREAMRTTAALHRGKAGRRRHRAALWQSIPPLAAAAASLALLSILALLLVYLHPWAGPARPPRTGRFFTHRGLDWIEVRWSSDQSYAGRIHLRRAAESNSASTGPTIEYREESATSSHCAHIGQLVAEATYDMVVLGPDQSELWKTQFHTLTVPEITSRALAALHTVEAGPLALKFDDELSDLHFQPGIMVGGKMKEFKAHAQTLLDQRLGGTELSESLALLQAVKKDAFSGARVEVTDRRGLWMALEGLEDLRTLCQIVGLKFPIAFTLASFHGGGYGPVDELSEPVVELKALRFKVPTRPGGWPSIARRAQLITTSPIGLFSSLKGFPAGPWTEGGDADGSVMPHDRLIWKYRVPVAFPSHPSRLEVGLLSDQLVTGTSFVLLLGDSLDRLEEVAVFREAHHSPLQTNVSLDPRLVGPATFVGLAFRVLDALVPSDRQNSTVAQLLFNCN